MNVVISILSEPSIALGVVAFAGLTLRKKPLTKAFEGTLRTVIRFLVFNLGDGAVIEALRSFNALFQVGFHINGVVAISETVVALAGENYRCVVSITFIVTLVANLLFARFTRFKSIVFLTNIQFMFGAMLALVIRSHRYSNTATVLVGGVSTGFASTFLPKLCQSSVRKITESNDIAIGRFSMYAYALLGYIGKLFSKYESESTEGPKPPGWLSSFEDFTLGMSVIMLALFYIASFAAGQQTTREMAGSVHWTVWPFVQVVTFTAGMDVLIYGIRMFLARIIAAFISISEKIIPNAKPALNCPTLPPCVPTSVMLGFLSAYIANLMAIFIMISTNAPVVFIPAANVCFFLGGTAGVLDSSTDGWRGTIAGFFVTGLLLLFLPLMMYPVLAGMGAAQSTFPAMNYNVVSITIHGILTLVGKIF